MAADITFDLELNTRGAVKSVKRFGTEAEKAFKSVESSLGVLKTVAIGAVGVLAGQQLVRGLNAVTDAAIVQEDAVNQLNTALKLAGDFSEESSKDLQDFASELQQVTRQGDETTLQLLALSKSFGASNDQAKELVTAGADLAAALGIDAESAVRNLGKSFGGLAGELGELLPEIKNLTEEELKAGAAIDLVTRRFGGAAIAATNTYGGAVDQLSNNFGDLLEELGFIITKNPVVIQLIKSLSEAFQGLGSFINENSDTIREFINNAIIGIVNQAPKAVKGIANIARGTLELAKGFNRVDGVVSQVFINILKGADGLADAFKLLTSPINAIIIGFNQVKKIKLEAQLAKISDESIKTNETLRNIGERLGANSQGYQRALENAAKRSQEYREEVSKLQSEIAELDKISEIASVEIEVDSSALQQTLQTRVDAAVQTEIELEGFEQKIDDLATTVTESAVAFADEVKGAGKAAKKDSEDQGPTKDDAEGFSKEFVDGAKKAGIAVGTSFAGNILKGAEGAQAFVTQSLGAAVDVFAPGFGQAATAFLDTIINLGPDGIKQLIDEFINALPIVFDALAEALPVVVEVLAEKSDVIIIALAKGMVKVAIALIKNLDVIIAGLATSIVELFNEVAFGFLQVLQEGINFAPALKAGADEFIARLKTGYDNTLGKFVDGVDKLVGILQDLAESLSSGGPLGDIGGGGQGLIPDSVPVLGGLAQGGIVGGSGTSDTELFALTPGELVVDRSTTAQLQDFLASGGQSRGEDMGSVVMVLAQIANLLQQPINVSTTAEVDSQAFANINLELSRLNERTAV